MTPAYALLDSIAEFCRRTGMAESTFGRHAVNDGKFVARLRDGARITPQTFERVSSNLVLTGTSRNCAGGASPWGWLSCEEAVEPEHGYVFLCDVEADGSRMLPAKAPAEHEPVVPQQTTILMPIARQPLWRSSMICKRPNSITLWWV